MGCAQAFHPAIQAICESVQSHTPGFLHSTLFLTNESSRKATDVQVYTQMFRNAIERFTSGKAVLIGDAAHFMLPSPSPFLFSLRPFHPLNPSPLSYITRHTLTTPTAHGQGASSSIEDCAALEILLSHATPSNLSSRLEIFQQLRHPRATATQAMSNYMMAGYPKMVAEASRYYKGDDLPAPGAKTFGPAFREWFLGYDIIEKAREALVSADAGVD